MEDLNRLNCVFCGSMLSVECGHGYAALKMTEKLGQPVQGSSAQTQGTIREGTQVNQLDRNKKSWYESKAVVIFLIILFYPVGLYGMWKSSRFSGKTKWIVTGFFIFFAIISGTNNK